MIITLKFQRCNFHFDPLRSGRTFGLLRRTLAQILDFIPMIKPQDGIIVIVAAVILLCLADDVPAVESQGRDITSTDKDSSCDNRDQRVLRTDEIRFIRSHRFYWQSPL
jgi:hypothetical protein